MNILGKKFYIRYAWIIIVGENGHDENGIEAEIRELLKTPVLAGKRKRIRYPQQNRQFGNGDYSYRLTQ